MTEINIMVKRVANPARARLLGTVKNLKKNKAQVGYFREQGLHSSGFTYPALMYLHEVIGISTKSGKVYRRAFEMTSMFMRKTLQDNVNKDLNRLFKSGNIDPTNVLENFATSLSNGIKSTFGNPSILPSNSPFTIKQKGANTPLVETGELRDNLAYKVTTKKGINKT